MGSSNSRPRKEKVLEEKLRDEFSDIFASLHQDCQVSASACYYSAGRHEMIARFTELTSSAFGVMSAGGFGLMQFYKVGLSPKQKGILGGVSSVLAACFALSTLFGGIKNSARSPAILSQTFNEAASEWDELGHLLDLYKRVKVQDPCVNVSELEMMCREILRRRKEVGMKTKVENWAYKKAIKEMGLFPIEPLKFEIVEETAKLKEAEKKVPDQAAKSEETK